MDKTFPTTLQGILFLDDTFNDDLQGILFIDDMQGIAGGTFLYITFFEVLPHELNIPSKRLWKVF